MTEASTSKVEERIAALRKSYLISLPEKIDRIVVLWDKSQNPAERDQALADLSCECRLGDVGRAFYLLHGPREDINTELDTKVGDYLRDLMPNATIRNGDYPSGRAVLGVNVVLSDLNDLQIVRDYYRRSSALMSEFESHAENSREKLSDMEEEGKSLPFLL